MLPAQHIQYLNLPPIPQEFIDKLTLNFDQYQKNTNDPNNWWWSDSFNQEINKWCQKNICSSMYFAFQYAVGGLPVHKDTSKIKLNYVLNTGGSDVITSFYDEDKTTVLNSYRIDPQRWHLIKVDVFHGVKNISADSYRFSVTGQVF
jgi:hypothetical protein